ncbi:MAG: barstar family protein [Myxococcota bacterium]
MIVSIASIEGANIVGWNSFHDEFHRVFQFPDFYGRNMDAWIDCMSSLDDEADGLSGIHVEPGGVLTLEIVNARAFKAAAPAQFDALVECAAFVNWRRLKTGRRGAVLALSFDV